MGCLRTRILARLAATMTVGRRIRVTHVTFVPRDVGASASRSASCVRDMARLQGAVRRHRRTSPRAAIPIACLLQISACTRGTATGRSSDGATFGPVESDGSTSAETSSAEVPDEGESEGSGGGGGDSGTATDTTTGSVGSTTEGGDASTAEEPSESTSDTAESTEGTTTSAATRTVDLSGYVLVQTESDREFVLPAGTVVPEGGYVVVGREATADAFAGFWGIAWADDVVYLDSGDALPIINGDETFTLRDPGGAVVDGPSVAMLASTAMVRTDADAAASEASAWQSVETPNDGATPGSGDDVGGDSGVPYISEVADATGNGNFPFEFVEIRIAP